VAAERDEHLKKNNWPLMVMLDVADRWIEQVSVTHMSRVPA
jgi:hypothetical protein